MLVPTTGNGSLAAYSRREPHGGRFAWFAPLPAIARPVAGMPRELLELGRRAVASADAVAKDLFADDRATAWLCGSAMDAGIEARASLTAASRCFSICSASVGGMAVPARWRRRALASR